MSGPLTGVKIVEIAGIGPGPFGALMLADMGAEVVRIDRAQSVRSPMPDTPAWDLLNRGRRSVAVDLKSPEGVETVQQFEDLTVAGVNSAQGYLLDRPTPASGLDFNRGYRDRLAGRDAHPLNNGASSSERRSA